MVAAIDLEVHCRVVGAWRPALLVRLMPVLNRLPERLAIWIICHVIRGFGADIKTGNDRRPTRLRATAKRAD